MSRDQQNIRDAFLEYLEMGGPSGSGKVASYLQALQYLDEMLRQQPLGFGDCIDIWKLQSSDRLSALREFVLTQQKNDKSPWYQLNIPQSYLKKGFCSAALAQLIEFIPLYCHAEKVRAVVESHAGSEDELPEKLNFEPDLPENSSLGIDFNREVKIRIGQYAFRKMILANYVNRCAITGLDIPALNRASHIIPWAKRTQTRMDPRNGICLSATYDAAFDRHLISFDENYRLLVAREISDHYTSSSVREYFLKRKGQRLDLPVQYQPKAEYLEEHRNLGNF